MFEVCADSVTCEFKNKEDAISGFLLAYGLVSPDFDIFDLKRSINFSLEHRSDKTYEKGCLYIRDCN